MPWTINVLIGLDSTLMSFLNASKATIIANQEKIMATLDDVLAQVAKETTDINSLAAFVQGLEQQIKDALSGVTLPPEVQAKVDQVFTDLTANDAAILAAMASNVPPPTGATLAPATNTTAVQS